MDKNTAVIVLSKEKDTKNTVKFAEQPQEGQAPVMGTAYLQKWFAGNATQVRITIEKLG